MKHTHVDEYYTAYLEDTLPEPLRQQVEAHLHACPRCSAALAAVRLLVEDVRNMPRELPPAQFTAGVRTRLAARRQPPPLFAGWPVFAGAFAAVAVALLLVCLRFTHTTWQPTRIATLPPRTTSQYHTPEVTATAPPVVSAPTPTPVHAAAHAASVHTSGASLATPKPQFYARGMSLAPGRELRHTSAPGHRVDTPGARPLPVATDAADNDSNHLFAKAPAAPLPGLDQKALVPDGKGALTTTLAATDSTCTSTTTVTCDGNLMASAGHASTWRANTPTVAPATPSAPACKDDVVAVHGAQGPRGAAGATGANGAAGEAAVHTAFPPIPTTAAPAASPLKLMTPSPANAQPAAAGTPAAAGQNPTLAANYTRVSAQAALSLATRTTTYAMQQSAKPTLSANGSVALQRLPAARSWNMAGGARLDAAACVPAIPSVSQSLFFGTVECWVEPIAAEKQQTTRRHTEHAVQLRVNGSSTPVELTVRALGRAQHAPQHSILTTPRTLKVDVPATTSGAALALTFHRGRASATLYLLAPGLNPSRRLTSVAIHDQPAYLPLLHLAHDAGIYLLCPSALAEQKLSCTVTHISPRSALQALLRQHQYQLTCTGVLGNITPVTPK